MTSPQSKQQFLEHYDREHEITMRVLRAYPPEKTELRPDKTCRSARELAWVFALERGLGTKVFHNAFATAAPSGTPPPPPENWEELLEKLEQSHRDFRELVASAPESLLDEPARFFTGPKTMGDIPRMDFLWFLLHDQIHHRGQFSVYLRMAGGKVPSIYGPSGDEPWN